MKRTLWTRNSRTAGSAGFTLIELMAVMIILGLLAGVVTVNVINRMEKARKNATKTQLSQLEQSLRMFNLDCGFYPSSLDGLISEGGTGRTCKGWDGPYLSKQEIPGDGWNNPFHYASPGVHSTEYDLWSDGSDKEDGTGDDITSWATSESEEP